MVISRMHVGVVIDDPLNLRQCARQLQGAGFAVETYLSPADFLDRWHENPPGCVVLHLSMPGFSGLELQRRLMELDDAPPVLFVGGAGDVPSADEATLLDAVRAALQKERRARGRRAEQAAFTARLLTLTPREQEVLAGVVAGKLNKQIAADLGTAEKTIKVHRARVMHKMQVDSLAKLVRAWMVMQSPVPG